MSNDLINRASDVTADLPAIKITRDDIKKHFCALATDQEVAMGLAIVKSLKLNPFLREVHFIKYSQNDKMQIVVGYEVYLKRAERSGKLDGWTAGIDTASNHAWVKIHRKDWKEPFEWTVNLSEFDKKQSTWKQIPSFMGRKVAIAQGFRLCFPDELGGLPYTQEEHQVYDIKAEAETAPGISGKPPVSMPESTEEPMKAVDIIALSQAKVGDKLNVAALVISSKKSEDKKPHQYAVVDVLNEATVQLFIKVFGDFVDVKSGTIAVFKDVQVGEYNEKKQYVAQGVSSAS